MSFLNSIVKIYLNQHKKKGLLHEESFAEKQARIVSTPPANIAKQGIFEQVAISCVRVTWLNRSKQQHGVLVFLHGGSYNTGPYKQHWEYFSWMCQQTDMAGLLIDYRLAPQHPFPAGLDDVIAVMQHLKLENYYLLGDSAGAGLSVAACYKLHELREKLPQKLVLMSGWFDVAGENPALKLNAESDVMITFKALHRSAKVYADDKDPRNPLISPIYGDVSILPPTLIQIGTHDMLLWDNRKIYLQMIDAKVDVQYEEYENTFHDFMLVGFLSEAKKARKSQLGFLISD